MTSFLKPRIPLIIIILFIAVFFSGRPAQASETAALTVLPATQEINDVKQGDQLTRTVTLTNFGSQAGTWYSEKSVFEITNGQTQFVPNSDDQDLAGWITVGAGPFTIEPGQKMDVTVSIRVPNNATPGAHHGAIFFSETRPGTNPNASKVGTLFILRVLGGTPNTSINFEQQQKNGHFAASDPRHGSTTDFPTTIKITFDATLSKTSTISVVDSNNVEYSFGSEQVIDGSQLTKRMKATAPDGLYTVRYNACFEDGNCEPGNFQFEIKKGVYVSTKSTIWLYIFGGVGLLTLIVLILVILKSRKRNTIS